MVKIGNNAQKQLLEISLILRSFIAFFVHIV